MPNRNIRQGYEHWGLTAMYPIGIYLIGTQRAAPCRTSLAPRSSTACRSRPWPGSSRAGVVWMVPSQSGGGGRYEVSPDPHEPHCTCPDHETHGVKCKHIYAVEYAMRRESDVVAHAVISDAMATQRAPVGRRTRRTGRRTTLRRRMRRRSSKSCCAISARTSRSLCARATGARAFPSTTQSSAPASRSTRPCRRAGS